MEDNITELVREIGRFSSVGNAVRVMATDMRDRLGLEHDKLGRFAKKDGSSSETGVEFALSLVDKKKLESVRAVGNYTTADGKKHDTRINNNTGKPISKALNDCIDALMCGVAVTAAEIEQTPEWKLAREQLRQHRATNWKKNGFVYTHNIDTKERGELRSKVESDALAEVITREQNPDAFDYADKTGAELKPWKVKRGHVIDVITGLPAAGKSTTFANKLSVENEARLIDSDEFKKRMPEYNRGLGADMVHEESSRIAKRVFQKAVERGENITYPVIGFKADKLREMFKYLRDNGYTIRLHLNEMDANKAKGRMLLRFAERGRFLPLSLFRKYGNKPTDAYNAVKGEVDFYEKYRSETGIGEKPKLIEKGGKESK